MGTPTRRRLTDVALSLGLTAIVVFSTLDRGVPALRHDWHIPAYRDALIPWIETFLSPWVTEGIGRPQPYPTFYLIGIAILPLALFREPLLIAIAFVGGSALLAASASLRLANGRSCSLPAKVAIAAVATLNPWFYSELVAGHIVMTVAYGLTLSLVSEIDRPSPRMPLAVVLSALAVTQIEFYPIVAVIMIFWTWRTRAWRPLAALLVAGLPIAIGIIGEYGRIRTTPIFLPWQVAQSISFPSAFVLRGYEFGYDRAFDRVAPALVVVEIIAAIGVLRIRRGDALAFLLTGIGSFAAIFASGTKGPISGLYSWAVEHVVEVGLYRELYDLVAFVAVAEVVLLSRAFSGTDHKRIARINFYAAPLGAIAGIALAVPWFSDPVFVATVPTWRLVRLPPSGGEDRRIALMPAFQPLGFKGLGTGADPDTFDRPGDAHPINELVPTYPVGPALSLAEEAGDLTGLRALGVSEIVERPWYLSDSLSLQFQSVGAVAIAKPRTSRTLSKPLPVLGFFSGAPQRVAYVSPASVGQRSWDAVDSVEGMSCSASGPLPDVHTLKMGVGWVSLGLAALSYPYLQTPFGGVITDSRRPLAVKGRSALVASMGSIVDAKSGTTLTTGLKRLRWINIPASTTEILCTKTCAVAAFSRCAFPKLDAGKVKSLQPLRTRGVPWAFRFRLAAGPGGVVRYAETYDSHFLAWSNGTFLPSVELDGVLMGWFVPKRTGTSYVLVVDYLALWQAIAEAFAVLSISTFALSQKPLLARS